MLSKRLQVASSYIDSRLNFADIGCDHGYLAIEAINKGVKIVQLVDNKEGPLNIAKSNLANYTEKATILYTLADGLTAIDERINIVAICGMGGDLITKIIRESISIAKALDYLILEANSKVDNLRRFLNSEQFIILDEEFVVDRNKYYQILKVKYQKNCEKISEKEIEFGPILLKKMSPLYKEYLINKKQYLEELLSKIEKKEDFNLEIKYKMIKEILNETK